MTHLNIIRGDITEITTDAIVNAANETLLGGGGVDGAIHIAAGEELYAECAKLGGCHTGEAKITKGYNLPAKHIIHTVGPVYGRENGHESELLTACYRNSLLLAKEYGLRSIAFSAISTGVFGYPKAEAAVIALTTVKNFVAENPVAFDRVDFVLFDDENFDIYQELMAK